MNASATVPPRLSRVKWLLATLLVFAAHLGLIFAFGSRKSIAPPATERASTVKFTTQFGEWQELNDPTLFARPHPKGFAGLAWMRAPEIVLPVFRWSEPARALALDASELGGTILNFVQSNTPSPVEFVALPPPEFSRPEAAFGDSPPPRPSALKLGGEFSQRRLISAPQLPARHSTDLLTNSIVQALVTGSGMVFSPTLLPAGGGAKSADQTAADQLALEIARTLRFAPLSNNATKWTVGTLIFEWQTLPQPEAAATNAPVKNP